MAKADKKRIVVCVAAGVRVCGTGFGVGGSPAAAGATGPAGADCGAAGLTRVFSAAYHESQDGQGNVCTLTDGPVAETASRRTG